MRAPEMENIRTWPRAQACKFDGPQVEEFELLHMPNIVELCIKVGSYFLIIGIQVQVQIWINSKI